MKRSYKLPLFEGGFPTEILRYGMTVCPTFMCVVRSKLKSSGLEFLTRLEPWVESVEEKSSWPGTELLGGQRARIHKFRSDPNLLSILAAPPGGLWSWIGPAYPENLCLLRADSSPWFVSITHERDGFLNLSDSERHEFEAQTGHKLEPE